MHSTRAVLGRGSISTNHGQKRILKHSTPDLVTYIQKAVQTGIYRSKEEIEEMNQRLSENPMELRRIRWNVLRGSKIEDYPKEYEILSLNPPPPFQPRMPLKYQRKAANKYIQENRPTDRLARNYLNMQQQSTKSGEPATAEEYYRRLLGANKAPKLDSAMGAKSAMVNKAYAVAMKQYHLMRTEKLSEKDALEKVEDILKQDDLSEKVQSRSKAERMAEAQVQSTMTAEARAEQVFPRPNMEVPDGEDKDDSDVAYLYSDNHKAFEGMISWTNRLQAVPYRHWTVGASVALDHWIAKRVLGLSEETWLALLEGDSPELMGRGRDIVMARHALFPETVLEAEALARQQDGSMEEGDEEDDADIGESDDLDELLKTLGGWGDDESSDTPTFSLSNKDSSTSADIILQLTEQLQDWRRKNVESPYESWSDSDKKLFGAWLEDYVTALTPESSLGKVDMNETRKALLAAPPQTKEDSDEFWSQIQDETSAEIFLQRLLAAKNVEGDDSSSHPFFQLEYGQQLDRLVQLGSIREIADEFGSEMDRSKFMSRYGDYLLEGVELDHLVADPTGPIRGSDLGERLRKQYDIGPNDRFRLELLEYGSDAFGTDAAQKAREIYVAWNKFKAGRAHYEEKLFQRGILGLTYEKEFKKN